MTARRILVPVGGTQDMTAILGLIGGIARASGGTVRLLVVYPIPKPRRDRCDRIVVSTDRQIEHLESRTHDELRALARASLEGVVVETAVVFGDRDVEIDVEAECFRADVVVTPARRSYGLLAGLGRLLHQLPLERTSELEVLRLRTVRAS